MALSYEQATEAYLLEALQKKAPTVSIDSPNRDRSQYRRGLWHPAQFRRACSSPGVGADFVRFAPT